MKKIVFSGVILMISLNGIAQLHLDQNGIKTSVIDALGANGTQARRYEIAKIGYNSYHWQNGGIIVIELFNKYYETGYERYILENGYNQGAQSGAPVLKLVESYGIAHSGKITLGTAYDLSTSNAGVVNRALPIYLDVRFYAIYKVKITHLQERVASFLTGLNEIEINSAPIGIDIPDFTVPLVLDNNLYSSGNVRITGNGDHYIQSGNVGIGTITPTERLSVNGKIRSKEVKVEATNWPDYVFAKDYKLPSLKETEKYIREKRHLPGIPSAAEVEKNGVELGDMNQKLLQKMEELTLHLIEKDKELDALKDSFKSQQLLLKRQQIQINQILEKK